MLISLVPGRVNNVTVMSNGKCKYLRSIYGRLQQIFAFRFKQWSGICDLLNSKLCSVVYNRELRECEEEDQVAGRVGVKHQTANQTLTNKWRRAKFISTFVACSADVRNGLANAFRISEEKGVLSYYTFSVLYSKIAAQLAAQPLNIQMSIYSGISLHRTHKYTDRLVIISYTF